MTRAERIESMERQLNDLKEANRAREARLLARKQRLEASERARNRRLDTRRRILAGSWILHEAGKSGAAADRLRRGLDGFLATARDRELFGLPPRPNDNPGETP